MQPDRDTQPQSAMNAVKPREETNKCEESMSSTSKERPYQENTAPALLSYDQQSDQPPKYNDAGIYATRQNPSTQPKPRLNSSNGPVNAAAVNAVMATSSSSTDKMHSQPSTSRKVDDWNADPTYQSRLASMVGSTRKWNYFGADVGGNPFRRSGGKK
jgi:hypothetical protein